jgi:hypothetical protein
MASCEPMFDLENRLADDECALADKDRQSDEVSGYYLANFLTSNVPACSKKVNDVANCHVNLRFRDGYGVANACVIDADSNARLGARQTNSPHRQTYKNRVFHGHGMFFRGAIQPEAEAALIHAEASRERRPCKGDIPADRFTPLIPCIEETTQNPRTVIMDQTWGGAATRSWVRDEDGLKACGYTHDGRMWAKR